MRKQTSPLIANTDHLLNYCTGIPVKIKAKYRGRVCYGTLEYYNPANGVVKITVDYGNFDDLTRRIMASQKSWRPWEYVNHKNAKLILRKIDKAALSVPRETWHGSMQGLYDYNYDVLGLIECGLAIDIRKTPFKKYHD